MSTPEDKKEIDKHFDSLAIFAYCFTCQALLLGAKEKSSFWGKRTSQVGKMHRTFTKHDVYINHKGVK